MTPFVFFKLLDGLIIFRSNESVMSDDVLNVTLSSTETITFKVGFLPDVRLLSICSKELEAIKFLHREYSQTMKKMRNEKRIK